MRFLIKFIFLYALITSCFAQGILTSSIDWRDQAQKNIQLAKIKPWPADQIQSLFQAYSHPERYALPAAKTENEYNMQFINAFWGVLNNPFNRIPRPGKAFVFLDQAVSSYYAAPIIQNAADGQYYIFERNKVQPTLLAEWVELIGAQHASANKLYFYICTAYGSYPQDDCEHKNYQNELTAAKVTQDVLINPVPSAVRDAKVDWQDMAVVEKVKQASAGSALSSSINWEKNDKARDALLSQTASWPNFIAIKDNFNKIRDTRYFEDEQKPGFLRRITWLYANDGCWTRAAAFIKDFFGVAHNPVNHFNRPSKIFAFGNLCANTGNSPGKHVTWWYHTAPVVKDASTNKVYVLDPSIDAKKPLLVKDWMKKIAANTGACGFTRSRVDTFNICQGYESSPNQSCAQAAESNYAAESDAVKDQKTYRAAERQMQGELKRDADKVLGESPPWK